jgi:hypothetical protein
MMLLAKGKSYESSNTGLNRARDVMVTITGRHAPQSKIARNSLRADDRESREKRTGIFPRFVTR